MESIKSQTLLPVNDFLLEELKEHGEQQIKGFLAEDTTPNKRLKSKQESEDDLCPTGPDDHHHTEHCSSEFIKTYFQSSRLHFIGTWKMRIENLIHENRKDHRFKHSNEKSMEFERVIVHVDMDCFFASVAMIDRPELKDLPFVVCHSQKKDGTAEISCSSYPARELGIRAGSFISSAFELCPTLKVVSYQFDKYQAISEQVQQLVDFCIF